MMSSDLIPISDEQAKALQDGFKLAGNSLDLARSLGGYLGKILGSVPEDLVGLLGADWIKVRRAENLVYMANKARERLHARQVEAEPAPLVLALPLIEGASDEDREKLVEMWARLLAATLDPKRRNSVRKRHIEIVKQFEPLDAAILNDISNIEADWMRTTLRAELAKKLMTTEDAVEVSMFHLVALNCAYLKQMERDATSIHHIYLSAQGRELLSILRD